MRAKGEQRSDPELGWQVPDSLTSGSTSGTVWGDTFAHLHAAAKLR
jgi:hypothetical protein